MASQKTDSLARLDPFAGKATANFFWHELKRLPTLSQLNLDKTLIFS